MEQYILKENEVILHRSSAVLLSNGRKTVDDAPKTDLWLTNLSIVLFAQKRKLFKTVTEVEVHNVSDVKVYNENVQVIRRKSMVDVFLTSGELFLDFGDEKEAKDFCDKAQRLISGESKFVRKVKSVKKAIKETDEALDIDIEGAATTGLGLAANMISPNGKMGALTKIAGALMKKDRKEEKQRLADTAESEKNN